MRSAQILAEGVSKRYPGRRALIFPPVLSIFERDLSPFKGRRSAKEADLPTLPGAAGEYDLDDDDDEDDGDDRDGGFEDALPPARARPDELFWALKDVSLSVSSGAALGVLGGPGAGKSTLLRVLSGRAFPTEGRVLVRGSVGPLPAELQKAIAVAGKRGDDLVLACRLLGVDPHLVKEHLDEIEELAQPLKTPDGDPERGARMRLAVATTAVLPASVVLLEDTKGLDDAFADRIFERLRERLRSGTSVVLASRRPEFLRELSDEVIVLNEGSIVDRGDATQTAGRYVAEANGGQAAKGRGAAKRRTEAEKLRVPPVVAGFNESAALLSAEVRSASGLRSKRLDADDELVVEIHLETAAPHTEVRCGVCFTPRNGETDVRIQLPEPARLAHPQTYVVVARIPPGTLQGGGYEVTADVIVAGGATPEASVIARYIGRLRIVGEGPPLTEAGGPPVMHWDGRAARHVDAEWSIE